MAHSGGNLVHAARILRRSPGFTTTAIGAIALGIAASTAIFSVVNKVLLDPLPYPAPDRLVQLISTSPIGNQNVVSIPKYLTWRRHTHVFETLAVFDTAGPSVNLTETDIPEPIATARVSADYFRLFGARVEVGRTFDSYEDSAGGPRVAIVSHALWSQRFGGNPGLAGSHISIEQRDYLVIGVLAAGFHQDPPADLWLPLRADESYDDHMSRVRVVGRLREGITLASAKRDVAGTLGWFVNSNQGAPLLYGESFTAIPLRDAIVGDVRPALYLFSGAVACVLLISCANVANLLLARSTRRAREIAIRAALGAVRPVIVRQLLTESMLLAAGGGLLGLVLGWIGVRELLAFSPVEIPRTGANGAAINLDVRVFLFTLAVSALTGLLFGLLPALSASRADLASLVKESPAQSGMGFRRNFGRPALVVLEMALALILLAGAGLLIRTFTARRTVNRGFDEQNVLTLEMSLASARFDRTAAVSSMVRDAQRQLGHLPGVTAVATTSSLPLETTLMIPFTALERDQRRVGRYHGAAAWRSVSPEFFSAFRIRVLRGRLFTGFDTAESTAVAIVNRAMVRKYWPEVDADPIGQWIQIGQRMGPGLEDRPRQIVGVVADLREAGLSLDPMMYIPETQVPDGLNARNNGLLPLTWVVRSTGTRPISSLAVGEVLRAASGGLPLGRVRTMHQVVAASSARTAFYTLLLGVFAGIALLLASVGLYGLMAYSVEQRAVEIAIRMALGAEPRDVRNMVLVEGGRLGLFGIAIGVPSAMVLARVMNSLIAGMRSWDPAVFAGVAVALATVAALASYLPSLRATRVDPVEVLRA
ncbi:MAG TPA: ABC transporter permease [Bryobacteraceae bacterium]|nr:ABC transporter permease [Bryobacteraceae bacterium]